MKLSDKQRDTVMRGKHAAALAESVGKYLAERLQPIEARLAELEARGTLEFVGVFEEGCIYQKGQVCTFDGSMWACRRETTSKPGTSDGWQLCVKRGRDGKDARR